MNKVLLLLATLIAVVIGGFAIWLLDGGSPFLPAPDNGAGAADIAFDKLTDGLHASVDERVNYVITSAEEFSVLWDMLVDAKTRPTIDFSKNNILAIFAGQVPNPGYAIGVSKITDTGGKRLVYVTLQKPGSGCIEPQIVASPYELVVAPKTDLTLAHEDTAIVKDCK
jgi:hypothetical protein